MSLPLNGVYNIINRSDNPGKALYLTSTDTGALVKVGPLASNASYKWTLAQDPNDNYKYTIQNVQTLTYATSSNSTGSDVIGVRNTIQIRIETTTSDNIYRIIPLGGNGYWGLTDESPNHPVLQNSTTDHRAQWVLARLQATA